MTEKARVQGSSDNSDDLFATFETATEMPARLNRLASNMRSFREARTKIQNYLTMRELISRGEAPSDHDGTDLARHWSEMNDILGTAITTTGRPPAPPRQDLNAVARMVDFTLANIPYGATITELRSLGLSFVEAGDFQGIINRIAAQQPGVYVTYVDGSKPGVLFVISAVSLADELVRTNSSIGSLASWNTLGPDSQPENMLRVEVMLGGLVERQMRTRLRTIEGISLADPGVGQFADQITVAIMQNHLDRVTKLDGYELVTLRNRDGGQLTWYIGAHELRSKLRLQLDSEYENAIAVLREATQNENLESAARTVEGGFETTLNSLTVDLAPDPEQVSETSKNQTESLIIDEAPAAVRFWRERQ